LQVDLPADNLDFQKLATQLMADLPRGKASRDALRAVLRLPGKSNGRAVTSKSKQATEGMVRVVRQELRIDDAWTVPAIELAAGGEKGTVILLADEGRGASAERAKALLEEGWRVLAVDPFYFGESKIKSHAALFAILVSSVGERPLGVQANQLHHIARWLKNEQKSKQVRVAAIGPRTSLLALAAAASDEAIDGVELKGSLGSLKEVIERGGQVDQTPEQFCFGLLETADVAQLAGLVVPREVKFVEPSERVKQELAKLKSAYEGAGKSFDPLAP
jgi:hypothetical protein